jgi:phenylalanyl-tRNA synthetase beta chain
MKVSIFWLKTLVDTPLSATAIADALTMAGLEVEEAKPVAPMFSGVVVAEVLSVDEHPDAQKLKVCRVRTSEGEPLQIVCGAPNVAVGMRVPCAVVGANLPGLDIKAATLRGVESQGMLCSARELGLSDDHGGLLALPTDAPIGADFRAWQQLDDIILTLKVTPNRGDCLSMIGVARDLAAVTGARLTLPSIEPVEPTGGMQRAVGIEARDACGTYCGRVIEGLNTAAVTPEWMKQRLERAGLRCISPLVDITNFVMLERGQPMHAFDHAKLNGVIGVRFAQDGESLKLLNEQTVELTANHLLITDNDEPVALGGVMGGYASMCTAETTSVFLEAAWFNPDVVRGRAAQFGFNSDAAFRFERGVDSDASRAAIELATRLVIQVCGTNQTRVGAVSMAQGAQRALATVNVRAERVATIIGRTIAPAAIDASLRSIGCEIARVDGMVTARPPSHRFDLQIEEDFIEEIARIEGYDKIGDRTPVSSLPMRKSTPSARSPHAVRRELAGFGYAETIGYSFVDASWEHDFCANSKPVRLSNPIASQMSVMRSSLIGGLVQALCHNLNHGESRVKLFEMGRCFLGSEASVDVQPIRVGGIAYGARYPEQWAEGGQKGADSDFFLMKGEVEALLDAHPLRFEPARHAALHPGRSASVLVGGKPVGILGELHPQWQVKYGLKRAPMLFELDAAPVLAVRPSHFDGFSRMQSLRRDIALCLPESVSYAAILDAVLALKSGKIVEFSPFDIYRGSGLADGQKSVAFRVVMQDTERTLTDIEADEVVAEIVKVLGEKFGATLRK